MRGALRLRLQCPQSRLEENLSALNSIASCGELKRFVSARIGLQSYAVLKRVFNPRLPIAFKIKRS